MNKVRPEIIYRMAWVIKYLYDKCKMPAKGNILQFESALDPWKNNQAFYTMMADIAVAEHSQHKAPDKSPKLDKIKDPYLIAHVLQATKVLNNMTKATLAEYAEKAFIPNTKFKRLLQQLGVEFLDACATATIPEAVQGPEVAEPVSEQS